jgi:uncharacterized protein with NRDE domain
MCTLIVLDRVVPGRPLVVAANRDEFYARPAAPPARIGEAGIPFVAPQDLEAGGTWMGLNAKGVFVGLTNRAVQGAKQDRRSRGLLVTGALGCGSAREVAERMSQGEEAERVEGGQYNPFHLLAADGQSAWLFTRREDASECRELAPGVHVVGNRDEDDPDSSKLRDVRARAEAIDPDQPTEKLFGDLGRLLASHPTPASPHQNPCVHTPGYGTRSSALFAVGEERWTLWYAEDAPCQAKYRNYSRLLDELR